MARLSRPIAFVACSVTLGVASSRGCSSDDMMRAVGTALVANMARGQGVAAMGGVGAGRAKPKDCGNLVINELRVSGPASAGDEFVELFNAGKCEVTLDGWSIKYLPASGVNGYQYWVPSSAGRTLAPGKYFVIVSKGYSGAVKDDDASSNRGLAEKGGLALLFNGIRVDSVTWGVVQQGHSYVETAAALAPQRAQSLARTVDGVDSNSNAVDFGPSTPTPGASNVGL